jgi:hypothetical protein
MKQEAKRKKSAREAESAADLERGVGMATN